MQRPEIAEICETATLSLRDAGPVPSAVRAIALGWKFETNPWDRQGRDGFRLTYRIYWESKPTEADLDFVSLISEYLISTLWWRLIELNDEFRVVPLTANEKLDPLDVWLFNRDFTDNYAIVLTPNKSPEPTAVGRFCSAFAAYVASRRWLSFLR